MTHNNLPQAKIGNQIKIVDLTIDDDDDDNSGRINFSQNLKKEEREKEAD